MDPVDAIPGTDEVQDSESPPLTGGVLQPWAIVADVIVARDDGGDTDAETVAAVLHLSYERDLNPKAIGLQPGIEQRLVHDIVSASEELLRSGDVSVERLAV